MSKRDFIELHSGFGPGSRYSVLDDGASCDFRSGERFGIIWIVLERSEFEASCWEINEENVKSIRIKEEVGLTVEDMNSVDSAGEGRELDEANWRIVLGKVLRIKVERDSGVNSL